MSSTLMGDPQRRELASWSRDAKPELGFHRLLMNDSDSASLQQQRNRKTLSVLVTFYTANIEIVVISYPLGYPTKEWIVWGFFVIKWRNCYLTQDEI